MDDDTRRVELSNGNWAVLRTKSTVGDVRFQREEAHRRGFEDPVLDGLALVQRLIVEWSYGDVTIEAIDALTEEDAVALVNIQRNAERPNPSRPSSDGSGPKGGRRSRGRSSGPSA